MGAGSDDIISCPLCPRTDPHTHRLCGRCYDEVQELFPANCADKPELVHGPVGMYHCGDCGAMVLAGYEHPAMCKPCIDRKHPAFDANDEESRPQ